MKFCWHKNYVLHTSETSVLSFPLLKAIDIFNVWYFCFWCMRDFCTMFCQVCALVLRHFFKDAFWPTWSFCTEIAVQRKNKGLGRNPQSIFSGNIGFDLWKKQILPKANDSQTIRFKIVKAKENLGSQWYHSLHIHWNKCTYSLID